MYSEEGGMKGDGEQVKDSVMEEKNYNLKFDVLRIDRYGSEALRKIIIKIHKKKKGKNSIR